MDRFKRSVDRKSRGRGREREGRSCCKGTRLDLNPGRCGKASAYMVHTYPVSYRY